MSHVAFCRPHLRPTYALAGIGVFLCVFTPRAYTGPVVTAKTENAVRYRLVATHGPMGPGHLDTVLGIAPAVFWTNSPFFFSTAAPPAPMTLSAAELVWHNIALHAGEVAPVGPYVAGGVIWPPPPGAPALRVGLVAGYQKHVFHPKHTDYTLGTLSAQYASPAAILGCTYAAVGTHDPPPDCYARGGGLGGREVVPPNPSLAFGSAAASIVLSDNSFDLALVVRGILPPNLLAARVCAGGPGVNGAVILDLGPPAVWQDLGGEGIALIFEGVFPLGYVPELIAGRTYVQIDTLLYPSGEIRGQLVAAPIYSNSGQLDDPFMVTRTGGQCGTDGDATDVQTALGLNTYGWDASAPANSSVADDFEVPHGQTWAIDGLVLYFYQTNATEPTVAGVDYAFSDTDLLGQPPPPWNPSPAHADFTTTFKKLDIDPATGSCERQVQKVFVPVSPAYVATEGRHWLAWRATGSTVLPGPFQPPVVVPGQMQTPGANGLQSVGGAPYSYVVDGGPAGTQQNFVFELTGAIAGQQTSGAGPGDTNCDGYVNFNDINPFVTALVSQANYEARYPYCPWLNADVNADHYVNFNDINPFVYCLVVGGCR